MNYRKVFVRILACIMAGGCYSSLAATIDITIQNGYSCSYQPLGIGMDRGYVVIYHSTAQGSFMRNLGKSTALGLWTPYAAANYARSVAPIGQKFTLTSWGSGYGSYVQFVGRKNALLRLWTCYGTFTVTPPPLACTVSPIRPLDLGTVNVGDLVTRSANAPVSITCSAPATMSAKIQTQLQLERQDVELNIGGKTLGLQPTVIARGVSSTNADIVATIRDKSFSSTGVKSASTVLVLSFE